MTNSIEDNLNLELHLLQDQQSFINTFLDSLPFIGIIVNDHKRILFFNENFKSLLSSTSDNELTGKCPGDAFGCINAKSAPEGCGSHPACQYCGITKTILNCQNTRNRTEQNTQLLIQKDNQNKAFDLKVVATPFFYRDHQFTIVTFEDLSAENRKKMLERIFFHDITNSIGALMGLSELFENDPQSIDNKSIELFSESSKKIYDEIQSQKILLYAESNDLAAVKVSVNIAELLKKSIEQTTFLARNQRKNIVLDKYEAVYCKTDIVLLQRVILNLLENALEAIPPGSTVTCDYFIDSPFLTISINNPGVILDEIKYHIFQRSFSTKGIGRGVGTYSVKLLTEQYLGGMVFFSSVPETGTTFYVRIPLDSTESADSQ
jgi:signal transduction histidine kinase